MNKIETNYLLENGITLQDWDRLLDLIGQSLYLKIGNNYNQVGLSEDKCREIILM